MLLRRRTTTAAQVKASVVAATAELWLVILLLQVALKAEIVATLLRLVLLHEVKSGRDGEVFALFQNHLP